MSIGTLNPKQTDSIKYLFVWPALFVVLLVTLFPLIYALTVSFQSVRLIPPLPVKFVGFDNYQTLLESSRFWQSVFTTIFIVFTSVLIQYVVGFLLAMALYIKVPGEKLFRVIFLLPMFMAPIAVALVARMMFHSALGPVNDFFSMLGFENLPFLTETSWALGVLVTVEVWQWTPFVTLLMLAGLQGLPKDVYEAASLENVPPWRQFWDITFPMLLPLSVVVVFIRIVEGFKIIDTVYILTGGGPGTSTETLTLFAYNQGFKTFNLGEASALSFLFLIVIVVLGSVYLAAVKPVVEKRS